MSLATCPNREELAEYVAGKLPDEASDSLAEHLDSCLDCQAALATLPDAEDTLVAQLRKPQADEPFLDEPQCDKAVARAKAMIGSTDAAAAHAEASTTLFPRRLGEYQLLERLGRGGMGTVYKVRQGRLDRLVALKILARSRTDDSHAVVRFEREMKAIGRLDHPNIVKAYDAREIDGTLVLVMELIDGLDLAEIVRRVGPLPTADACEMIRQAALALQYAHEHGLVHRDIKPSNLMLNRQGEIKLLDLGLARFFVEDASENASNLLPLHSEEMTGTGQAMGTADYMAPEQASDSRSVDIRADIYSLGCTFYKLLSGRAPFAGPDYRGTLDKMNAHVKETPLPIGQFVENLPPELENLLARMLAKDPADRFETPAEVAAAVGQICNLSNVGQISNLSIVGQISNLSSEVGQVPNLSSLISTALALPRESWAKADKSQDANFITSRPKIQPVRRRPIVKQLLIGLGFFGAMALCFAAGVWITIKQEGKPDTTVEVPYGSKNSVDALGNVKIDLMPGEENDYVLVDLAAKNAKAEIPPEPYKIGLGDYLCIRSSCALPDAPIDGVYRIEPEGTVALAADYGRIKIDGLSLVEAEKLIARKLDEVLVNPEISVTLAGWRKQPLASPPPVHKITSGDILNIWAIYSLQDQPIHGPYLVEPDGQVALGPAYGRVNLKGMTFLEAEATVEKKLAELLTRPDVSITLEGWRQPLKPTANAKTREDGKTAKPNANQPQKQKPPKFRTAKITRGDLKYSVEIPVTVEPEASVDVQAKIDGIIVSLGPDPRGETDPQYKGKTIDYGTPVEEGTILAKMDDRFLQLDVERETANVKREETVYQLAKKRYESGGIPIETFSAAEAELEKNKFALKEAEIRLESAVIKSPIKGIVIARFANVGQYAQNPPISFVVAKEFKKMKVRISSMEQDGLVDIGQVHEGMPLTLTVDAFPDDKFACKVAQIDRNSSSPIIVTIDNPDLKLTPGLKAKLHFKVTDHNVLLVPSEAIIREGTSTHLRIFYPNKPFKEVEVHCVRKGNTLTEIEASPEIEEGMPILIEIEDESKPDESSNALANQAKTFSPFNPAAELKTLQGQWKVAKQENGEAADTVWRYHFNVEKLDRILFQQDNVTLADLKEGKTTDSWLFRIDPTSEPKKIDILEETAEGEIMSSGMGGMGSMGGMGGMMPAPGVTGQLTRGKLIALGIYKIEKNQLKICLAKYQSSLVTDQRPKTFAFDSKSGEILLTLERYVPSEEEKKMQRYWLVNRFVDSGKETTPANFGNIPCGIDDFYFHIVGGMGGGMQPNSVPYFQGNYCLDETKTPKRITIQGMETGPNMAYVKFNGIYRLSDDGLTIAYRKNGDAPDKFESPPDSGVLLLELKKDQPKSEKKESPPTNSQAPAVNAPNPSAELHAMQGAWKVVKMEKGKHSSLPDAQLVLLDGRACEIFGMEWRDHLINSYSVDPTKSPKTIDLRFYSAGIVGELDSLGIYEFDGERLKLCLTKHLSTLDSDQRPKTLAIDVNSADASYLLEREIPSADFKLLQGYWVIDTELEEGKAISQVPRRHLKFLFNEHHRMVSWQGIEPGTPCGGAYLLDTTKTPARITMFVSELVEIDGAYYPRSMALIGIYKVEKDRLTIAYRYGNASTSVPDKFESTPDSGVKLLELKKEQPKSNASSATSPSAEPIKPAEAKQADVNFPR